MTFKHYHPDTFDSIRHEWDQCLYPDIALLRYQARNMLTDYKDDEVADIVGEIEAYVIEAFEASKDDTDDYVFNDADDIRAYVFMGIDDINPDKNKRKHYHYFATLTLMLLSKMALSHNNNDQLSSINHMGEAYRSYEDALVHYFVEEGADGYFIKYKNSFARKFASEGGKKSTSVLTQDKPDVLKEWEKIKSQRLSREQSADVIIENLKLKHQPSTILKWIREHEQNKNIVQSNGST